MAVSAGLGFDLEDVLQNAREADKVLGKMVDRSAELSNNMRKAFSVVGAEGMMQYAHQLQEIQKLLGGISNKTLTVDVDTKRVDELTNALGNISQTVDALTQGRKGIELFDTQGVYATTKGIMEAEGALSKVEAKIAHLRETYFKQTAKGAKATFAESIVPSMGDAAPQQGTKEYKDAEKKYLAQTRAARRAKQQEVEDVLKAEIEKRAIAQKELNYAKMTQDQKAAYVKQKMDEILRAEKANIDSIRNKYSGLLNQLSSLNAEIGRYNKAETSGKQLGDKGENTLLELEISRENVQHKAEELYRQHQDILADIAEKGALRRSELIKEIESRAYTKEEALSLANRATSATGTGQELRLAQKALESAKMGNTMIGDVNSLKELNEAIIKVKAALEELQQVEHKENALQPSIRAEYARTIREMDKLEKEMRELSTLQADELDIKGRVTPMGKEYSTLALRYDELQKRKLELEQQTNGLLSEEQRKHESEKTRIVIDEYKRRMAELRANEKKYGAVSSNEAYAAMKAANKVQNVVQEEKAVRNLIDVRNKLDKNDSKYEQTLAQLDAAIEKHKLKIREVTDATRLQSEQQKKANATLEEVRKSYDGAKKYSSEAKNVEELHKAIQYLDKARQKENLRSADGRKRYQELTYELERQKETYERLTGDIRNSGKGILDYAQQIKRSLALLFSVSAIRGYIDQLIQVRGEFELQQRSLQVLLQNKDEADQLWSKTVQLAVKSPFTVQQLVTYTKQLAAYRIESDKLYETNKMLADISAGLGVEMNRLILAYGQVKAANFLRGTELRQFSEAGVNILGELADRFTELEGRMVSVGEVFERVSKRMVKFSDVDAVLKDLTSKGGVFYRMQEIQSETLKGQIMNLRDSIDLMFNDIGESLDGTLKKGVGLVRALVNNWKMVAGIVKGIVVGFTLHKSVTLAISGVVALGKALKNVRAMIQGAKAAQLGFNAATAANPWLLLASVIVAAGIMIYDAISQASAEQERFNKITREGIDEAFRLAQNFEFLADKAVNAADGSKEQKEALEELDRTYSGIISSSDLTIERLRAMKGSYDSVTTAIYAKIEAQTREKHMNELPESEEYKELEERKEYLVGLLTDLGIDKNLANSIVSQVVSEFQMGKLKNMEDFANRINELAGYIKQGFNLLEITEKEGSIISQYRKNLFSFEWLDILSPYAIWRKSIEPLINSNSIKNSVSNLYEGLVAIDEKVKDINNLSIQPILGEQWSDTYEKVNEAFDNITTDITAKQEELKNKGLTDIEIHVAMDEFTKDKQMQALADLAKSYDNTIDSGEELAKFLRSNNIQIPTYVIDVNTEEGIEKLDKFAKNAKDIFTLDLTNQQAVIDSTNEIIDALNLKLPYSTVEAPVKNLETIKRATEDVAKALNNTRLYYSELNSNVLALATSIEGLNLSSVGNALVGDSENLEEYRKRIEGIRDELKSIVETVNQKNIWDITRQLILSGKTIEEVTAELSFYEELLKRIDELNKRTTNIDKDAQLEMLKKRIEFAKKLAKEYKRLRKEFSEEETMRRLRIAFEEESNDIRITPLLEQFLKTDSNDVAGKLTEFLNMLYDTTFTPERLHSVVTREISTYEGEIGLEDATKTRERLKREIEDLFERVDLTNEIKKLGISDALAQSFGFTPLTLKRLKKQIEDDYKPLLTISTEGAKDYENFLKKIEEIEHKSIESRMKTYSKYLKRGYGEAIRIKLEEIRQLEEIEALYAQTDISERDRDRMVRGVRRDTQEKLDTVAWEEFKGSETYTQLFEDIEYASTKSIKNMLLSLELLRGSLGNLPANELKDLIKQMGKLEDVLIRRNPFKELSSSLRRLEAVRKGLRKVNAEGELTDEAISEEQLSEERENAERSLFQSQDAFNSLLAKQEELRVKRAGMEEGAEAEALDLQIEQNDAVLDGLEETIDKEKKVVKGYKSQEAAVENVTNNVKKSKEEVVVFIGATASALASVSDIAFSLESVFGSMSQSARDALESLSSVFTGVSTLMIGVKGVIEKPVDIGAWVQSLQGLASVISSIAGIGDKTKERAIQRQINMVEKLQRAYEKLEEAIDNAYSMNEYEKSYTLSKQNIEEQIAATQRMINLEKGKKKSDSERIKEWENEIEDLYDQLDELEAKRIQSFGGLGSDEEYKSAAEAFVEAWMEAFKETGDGLSGLEEQFNETINNMVKNQLLQRGTSKFLEPFFEQFDKMFAEESEGAGAVTKSELDSILNYWGTISPQLNDFLKSLIDGLGITQEMLNGEDGSLSELQKGIQGISEQTAQALEALLNSIRLYVATGNEYAREQLTYTKKIFNLLDGLTAAHASGGRGFRVII